VLTCRSEAKKKLHKGAESHTNRFLSETRAQGMSTIRGKRRRCRQLRKKVKTVLYKCGFKCPKKSPPSAGQRTESKRTEEKGVRETPKKEILTQVSSDDTATLKDT